LWNSAPPRSTASGACYRAGHRAAAQGRHRAPRSLARLEDLPGWANTVIGDLLSEVSRLDERIAQYDRTSTMARQSTEAQQLMQLGVSARPPPPHS
jgi:hypothetical protein